LGVDGGLQALEAACESYVSTGATLFRPCHLSRLAIAREAAGDLAGALAALDEAVAVAERNAEHVHLPEVLLRRAELSLVLPSPDRGRAADDLRRAAALADEIGVVYLRDRLAAHLAAEPVG
jgi:hypothetical protein